MHLPRGVIRRQGQNFNRERAKNTKVRPSKKPTRSKTRIKLITKLERCRVKDEIRRTNLRSPWLAYCGGTLRLHFKGREPYSFAKMKLPMERYLCSNASYCHLRSEEWNYRQVVQKNDYQFIFLGSNLMFCLYSESVSIF